MPASIYRSEERQAEILRLYDEALSHLRIGHEGKTLSTRYGETPSSPWVPKTPRR